MKGLREMLEISCRNGSYSNPLMGPKMTTRSCQTETEFGAVEASESIASNEVTAVETEPLAKASSNGFKSENPRTFSEGEEDGVVGRATSSMNGSMSPHAR